MALKTDYSSWPNSLPAAQIETGVIAASFVLNPLGAVILPGKDDGAVPLAKTHLNGEKDFFVIKTGHTRIKQSQKAVQQALCFIQQGQFCRELD